MTRKTAHDLEENADSEHALLSSVGGAMSQWPRRTLNWFCREQRVNSVDEYVARRFIDREVEDLIGLERLAVTVNVEIMALQMKRKALQENDVHTILNVLHEEYENKYNGSDQGWVESECPFEESGMDKACWACPVAGNALEELENRLEATTEGKKIGR